MKIKQLFCKHIYKDTKQELLKERFAKFGSIAYYDVNTYAIFQTCIRCDKKRIIEIENRDYK